MFGSERSAAFSIKSKQNVKAKRHGKEQEPETESVLGGLAVHLEQENPQAVCDGLDTLHVVLAALRLFK